MKNTTPRKERTQVVGGAVFHWAGPDDYEMFREVEDGRAIQLFGVKLEGRPLVVFRRLSWRFNQWVPDVGIDAGAVFDRQEVLDALDARQLELAGGR